jgi:hypothetical protein
MPYDRPTKEELVGAVREFMEQKLLPELKGHTGFNTRVAINVLKTVERELKIGSQVSQEANLRLKELLDETEENLSNRELNKKLSEMIDQRDLSYKDQALVNHLWHTTMGKLAVDNPRYTSFQKENNSEYWREFYQPE